MASSALGSSAGESLELYLGAAEERAYPEGAVLVGEDSEEAGPVPAVVGREVAVILDTSGSMRDSATGALWDYVMKRVGAVLDGLQEPSRVSVMDTDGRLVAAWPQRGGEGQEAFSDKDRASLLEAIGKYGKESSSRFDRGLLKAARGFEGAEPVALILGDEYRGDGSSLKRLAIQLDRIFKRRPFLLSVYSVQPMRTAYSKPTGRTAIQRFGERSPFSRFSLAGGFLAQRYGGELVIMGDQPKARGQVVSLEGEALLELARRHEERRWGMDLDAASVALLNLFFAERGVDVQVFALQEDAPIEAIVSARLQPISAREAFCHVEFSSPDLSEVRQYRAKLGVGNYEVSVVEWIQVVDYSE